MAGGHERLAPTREGLALISATKPEMERLAMVEKLIVEHHRRAAGASAANSTAEPPSVVRGLLVRYRLEGGYHLRLAQRAEAAPDGSGKPLFVVQEPRPDAPSPLRKIPLHSLSSTSSLAKDAQWEAAGRHEVAALVSFWRRRGETPTVAEAAAAAWRKQVALGWEAQYGSLPTEEAILHLPMLLAVTRDAGSIAQARELFAAEPAPALPPMGAGAASPLGLPPGSNPATPAAAAPPAAPAGSPAQQRLQLSIQTRPQEPPPPGGAFPAPGAHYDAPQDAAATGWDASPHAAGGFGVPLRSARDRQPSPPPFEPPHGWHEPPHEPRRVFYSRGGGGGGSWGGYGAGHHGGGAPQWERWQRPGEEVHREGSPARRRSPTPSPSPRRALGAAAGAAAGAAVGEAPLAPVLLRHFRHSAIKPSEEWELIGREVQATGLAPTVTERTLGALFREAGATVRDVRVTREGDPRGELGFVVTGSASQAAAAVECLQGVELEGRRVFLRGMRKEIEHVRRTMPEAAAAARAAMAAAAADHARWQEGGAPQHAQQRWPRRGASPPPRQRSPSPPRGRSHRRSASPEGSPASRQRSPRWAGPGRSRSRSPAARVGAPFWDPVWQLEWDCLRRLQAAGGPLTLRELLEGVEVPPEVGQPGPGVLSGFLARRAFLFDLRRAGDGELCASPLPDAQAWLRYKRSLLQYLAARPPRVALRQLEEALPPPASLPDCMKGLWLSKILERYASCEVWRAIGRKAYHDASLFTVELQPFAAGAGGPRFPRICGHFRGTSALACPDQERCELPHAPQRAFK